MTRVAPLSPLTPGQLAVVAVLAEGYSHVEAAEVLGVEVCTIFRQIHLAARKVPGDLRPRDRLVAWWRGAPQSVLGYPSEPFVRQRMALVEFKLLEWTPCGACHYVRDNTRAKPLTPE